MEYRLAASEVDGVDNIVAIPYRYLWTLELSDSPWPVGLELPYEIPSTFYGHPIKLNSSGQHNGRS